MIDICENCYEEANLVKVKGMQVCKSCVSDLKGESVEDPVLDLNDEDYSIMGVMSDADVIDMYRDEYVGY